jgi:hypothetical protein
MRDMLMFVWATFCCPTSICRNLDFKAVTEGGHMFFKEAEMISQTLGILLYCTKQARWT